MIILGVSKPVKESDLMSVCTLKIKLSLKYETIQNSCSSHMLILGYLHFGVITGLLHNSGFLFFFSLFI